MTTPITDATGAIEKKASQAYAGPAHPFAQRFGELVLYARKAKCMSQRDVADAVGCTQPHIVNLEKGRVDPDLSLAVRLMEVLGLDYRNVFDTKRRNKRAA